MDRGFEICLWIGLVCLVICCHTSRAQHTQQKRLFEKRSNYEMELPDELEERNQLRGIVEEMVKRTVVDNQGTDSDTWSDHRARKQSIIHLLRGLKKREKKDPKKDEYIWEQIMV